MRGEWGDGAVGQGWGATPPPPSTMWEASASHRGGEASNLWEAGERHLPPPAHRHSQFIASTCEARPCSVTSPCI